MQVCEELGAPDRGTLVQADEVDTRARRVVVTRKGKALAPKAIAAVEAVDAEFFAQVPPKRTREILARLVGEEI